MTGANLQTKDRMRGFTLIELLVVFGIISVLTAVALPNILGFMRLASIRTAQDQLTGALQKARNAAIMKNTQMGITLVIQNTLPGNVDGPSIYWVHAEDTIAGVTGGVVGFTRQGIDFNAPNAVLSTRYQLPDRVVFAALGECPQIPGFAPLNDSLRFDRYGQSSGPPSSPPSAATNALILLGGSTPTPRVFIPAAGDRRICLIDRRTDLKRWVSISPSGRIAKS